MPTTRYERDPGQTPHLSPEEKTRLDALSQEEIERNAQEDKENPPSSEAELKRAIVARRLRTLRQSWQMSQSEFASKFKINLGRLRDIEQSRTMPDSAFLAYLTVIEKERKAVERALTSQP